jgi:arsenate reductase (glutaredoxin)
MAKIKIWHNPRCTKSRQGLNYLNDKKCDVDIFEYLKEEINPTELAEIIKKSVHPLEDFIRTNEAEYKELGLKSKSLTAEEFAEIATKHPKLLQRPIIIKDGKAVIARPTKKIDELF